MPKIKIKDFKGIFTNIDENDSNLEAVRDSINFAHKRGFLEFVPRRLREFPTLPDTSGFTRHGGAQYTWTYETGIYTTLTSDRLTTDIDAAPASYDVLILILKTTYQSINHRLIYLWDGNTWTELSNYNSPKLNGYPYIDIVNYSTTDGSINTTGFYYSYFSTELDGTSYFQEEDGRLKVYLPHMAFWIGKLNRKIWIPDETKDRWPVTSGSSTIYPYIDYENYTGWYIDRLAEDWDHANQKGTMTLNGYGVYWDQHEPIGNATLTNYRVFPRYDEYEGRRLGIYYDVEANTDLTSIVDATPIDVGDPHGDKVRWEGAFKRTRHSLYDENGLIIRNPNPPFPANPEIWTFIVDYDRTQAELGPDWSTDFSIAGNYDKCYVGFLGAQKELFRPEGNAAWSTIPNAIEYTGAAGDRMRGRRLGGFNHEFPIPAVSISVQDWLNLSFEYGGDQTVDDIGYESSDKEFALVTTAVLDDREEIPIDARIVVLDVSSKFAIRIKNIHLPWNINKRITRIRFYHAVKDAGDLELVKEFDLLTSEASIEEFQFTEADKTGITLAGNIGYLWDYWDRPGDLKLMNGFRSFVTESGISIGLSTQDLVGIYHSTFGGGQLMPDLIYDDNRLPVSGVKRLTAVGNADGRLMAFTDNTAYAIEAEEVAGVIGFRMEDTVEVGVKNQQDVANIQGGVAVHTIHGIYVTNGYETNSISQPIDDIIVTYYSTGRIYYNRYKHYLYYKPTNAEDLYRYRFVDNVWERINKTTTSEEVTEEEEAID